MAKRSDRRTQPHPFAVDGMAWDLIEPMLRAAEAERPSCSIERRDPFASFFSAVRNVRQCTDSGTPCLAWERYGIAMMGGPYVRQCVARQATCPACGALIASNYGKPCQSCRVERRRAKCREFSRNYRRRHGLVQSFPMAQCAHCSELFEPKRSTAKFCSTRCRVAAHRATGKPIRSA